MAGSPRAGGTVTGPAERGPAEARSRSENTCSCKVKEWGQTSTIHSSRGFRVNVKECGMRDVPDKLTFVKDGAV